MSNQLDATIAKRFDITVKQNQTFDPLLTFTDDAGIPINLAGTYAKLSVRQQDGCIQDCQCPGESPFNLLYKQDFYATITGISNNKLQFNEIVKLTPATYKYDLLITFPDGSNRYFLIGSFHVKRSYTDNDH